MDETTLSVLDELSELGLSYLASPYRAQQSSVEQGRVRAATRATSWLQRRGITAFSPITHSTAIKAQAKRDGNPITAGYDLWQSIDAALLDRSSALLVLTMPGWEDSEGVTDEIHSALDVDMPIFLAIPQPQIMPLSQGGDKALQLRRAPYSTDRDEKHVEIQNELFVE